MGTISQGDTSETVNIIAMGKVPLIRSFVSIIALSVLCSILTACAGGAVAPLHLQGSGGNVRSFCPPPTKVGEMACLGLFRTDIGGANPGGYHGEDFGLAFQKSACDGGPPYCASDLQAAYGLSQVINAGRGGTVAIVLAFGYVALEADLAVYRKAMNLPPCASASGCLLIVNQDGMTSPLPPQTNATLFWTAEQAMDIDMVSAICPHCKIIVVQANAATIQAFGAAVDAAVALGADAVNNSYDGGESSADNSSFFHPGHAIVAAAGDSGAGAAQPCSFAGVVCVGGTSLSRASNIRGWSESTWNDGAGATGSGCSSYVLKPSWQTDKGCTMRSESDISAVADPHTGVAVYNSNIVGGWIQGGGTSAAAPIIAALFALAGNTQAIGSAPQWVWQHGGTTAFNDIVTGSNSVYFQCPQSMLYICTAGPGYDGPTGWGTPNGLSGF